VGWLFKKRVILNYAESYLSEIIRHSSISSQTLRPKRVQITYIKHYLANSRNAQLNMGARHRAAITWEVTIITMWHNS